MARGFTGEPPFIVKTKLLLSFLSLSSLLLAGRGPGPANCGACPGGTCAAINATSTDPVELSAAAHAALLFQIDEERMAHDLYVAFGEAWDLRPFRNIAAAETRHAAALKALAERAGVTVPAATPGTYATAEVQARYDALLAQGQISAMEALQASAFVEEQDIVDLRALAATTDSPDLESVVAALETGSTHHLNAFVRNLSQRGVDYTPQRLDASAYADLIAAGGHRGRGLGAGRADAGGCGRGRGCGRR